MGSETALNETKNLLEKGNLTYQEREKLLSLRKTALENILLTTANAEKNAEIRKKNEEIKATNLENIKRLPDVNDALQYTQFQKRNRRISNQGYALKRNFK